MNAPILCEPLCIDNLRI